MIEPLNIFRAGCNAESARAQQLGAIKASFKEIQVPYFLK